MARILFVDDHPIYRDGLRRALEARIEGLEVIVAAGATEARQMLAADASIALVLADYRLVDGDGFELIAGLRASHAAVAVGLLCGEPTQALAAEVRAIGGVACLPKELETEELADAVESILEGDEAFPSPVPGRGGALMSERRRDILTFASKGWPDKLIGEELGITESTVRNHWHHIFRRLGVNNRTEAVTKALRQKII
ncbi:MAG TPA: response regulator transcription factor [Rhodoblastus sp.]|nr:response regulator transcription factor [Rhodoblastus sp.]